jgi:integrase
MSNVRARKDGRLFFDFYYRGVRCRELTSLPDTPDNRRKMERALRAIDVEIANGTFDYARTFPGGRRVGHFAAVRPVTQAPALQHAQAAEPGRQLPTFAEFTRVWKAEKEIEWRHSYRETAESVLSFHLLPEFGELALDEIDRAGVLRFRSQLGNGTDERQPLAPTTINRTIGLLQAILQEAELRFDLPNPCRGIRRLKLQRTDITPFTVEEMRAILQRVRADYRPYLTLRFLTGMRSGEANGLRWKHVDFQRSQLCIRETFNKRRTEYTKTDGSQREIYMSTPVRDALLAMLPEGYEDNPTAFEDQYVFMTCEGYPVDNANFTNRVWKPLLRNLGLKYRRPYEMRHTSATLWLAAGESPEWIARQLGHTTTEMLFRTYSRYVPDLIRQDGNAFDALVTDVINLKKEERA